MKVQGLALSLKSFGVPQPTMLGHSSEEDKLLHLASTKMETQSLVNLFVLKTICSTPRNTALADVLGDIQSCSFFFFFFRRAYTFIYPKPDSCLLQKETIHSLTQLMFFEHLLCARHFLEA